MKFIVLLPFVLLGCSSNHYIPRESKLTSNKGYVMVVPLNRFDIKHDPKNEIKLINKSAQIVKKWKTDFNVFDAKLDDKGNIYISGNKKLLEHGKYVANGINNYFEVRNRQGIKIWSYENDLKHHDFKVLPNGNISFIEFYPRDPKEEQILLKNNKFFKGKVWPDRIKEINPKTGKIVWSWDSHKYIKMKKLKHIDKRGDLLHCNSINYIENYYKTKKPAYILSCRHTSTVYIIDKLTKEILWESPERLFKFQHDATFINDHTIMAFSNGFNFSSVIEYDLKAKKKTWVYKGGEHPFNQMQFYSSFISGAQRLKNGNTLITLGVNGFIVEVDPTKKVVWNFFNEINKQDLNIAWPYKSIFKARLYDSY